MQGSQSGAYQVRPLGCIQHKEAQLVDKAEVSVQAGLQLLGLRLCQLPAREVKHLLAQQLEDDLEGRGGAAAVSASHKVWNT